MCTHIHPISPSLSLSLYLYLSLSLSLCVCCVCGVCVCVRALITTSVFEVKYVGGSVSLSFWIKNTTA